MGLRERLFRSRRTAHDATSTPTSTELDATVTDSTPAHKDIVLLEGTRLVQAVGESDYQDALARICGGKTEAGHHRPVTAMLSPEPDNPYDSNAVAVLVEGLKVGHLAREDASALHTQLVRIAQEHGCSVACRGEIVGGWHRSD